MQKCCARLQIFDSKKPPSLLQHLTVPPIWTSTSQVQFLCHLALNLPCSVALTPALFLSCSFQFDSEYQFNSSVKSLLSRLPKQRYLKSICDDLHSFKFVKKYVGCIVVVVKRNKLWRDWLVPVLARCCLLILVWTRLKHLRLWEAVSRHSFCIAGC